MRRGAIVLCGGQSLRMGISKALLPFGPETMLQRVVRLLSQVVEPIVVVSAADQTLPLLPAGVRCVHDEHPDRGPLEGLAAGLQAIEDAADACYVTGCDVPLLEPAFVAKMFELLGDCDAAVPAVDGFRQSLAAVCRPGVLSQIRQLLAADRLKTADLFDQIRTREVAPQELQDVDPRLGSLDNLNEPAAYFAALQVAGFNVPEDIRAKLAR